MHVFNMHVYNIIAVNDNAPYGADMLHKLNTISSRMLQAHAMLTTK